MKLIMKVMFCFFLIQLTFLESWCQLSDESNKLLNQVLNQKNISKDEIEESFIQNDFSSLWLDHYDATLGFIGDNYQRLFIKFISVIRNGNVQNGYYAFGKSKVKENVCDFIGEIEILHIRKFNESHIKEYLEDAIENQDEEVINRFKCTRYILIAKYRFYEDRKQDSSGELSGIFMTRFIIKDGKILYDDLDIESDDFCNNQFVGDWVSYTSRNRKKCNWGDYRIPFSNDLDVGVGEFSPNEKYLKNGWTNYYRAYTLQDINAKKVEESIWW